MPKAGKSKKREYRSEAGAKRQQRHWQEKGYRVTRRKNALYLTEDGVVAQIQALKDLHTRFKQAFVDRDLEALLGCTSEIQFQYVGCKSTDPTRWKAAGSWNAAAFEPWARTLFSRKDWFYTYEVEFLHIHARNGFALIVTREKGKSIPEYSAGWDGVGVWFATKASGEWKIMGEFTPDGTWVE